MAHLIVLGMIFSFVSMAPSIVSLRVAPLCMLPSFYMIIVALSLIGDISCMMVVGLRLIVISVILTRPILCTAVFIVTSLGLKLRLYPIMLGYITLGNIGCMVVVALLLLVMITYLAAAIPCMAVLNMIVSTWSMIGKVLFLVMVIPRLGDTFLTGVRFVDAGQPLRFKVRDCGRTGG